MILIAGGAGYIGSHTNKILTQKGYETVVYDSLICGYREFVKWGRFVHGDLADKDKLRDCFKKYSIDTVMHFCAFIEAGQSVVDPIRFYRNNVANTISLIEVMNEFDVKNFIFSSTAAVYGQPQKIPIPEDHQLKPINPYGKSKLMIERILADCDNAYGIKHVNLRYFNAAGADPDAQIGEKHNPESHLIPLIIYAVLGKRNQIEIFGTDYPTEDGTCIRDYIHVTDLADAHIKALKYLQDSKGSCSFNLGNGKGFSVRQVIETVRKIAGKSFKVVESNRRPGDAPVLIASSHKAVQKLNWRPKYDTLETIVQTAYNWHKSQIKD